MLADAVLTAVSEGRAESVALAQELAEAVLGQEEVQRAARPRRLLGQNSPFTLVRAVELAEILLGGIEARSRKPEDRQVGRFAADGPAVSRQPRRPR
jgi:hypothetical protein